MGQGLLGRFQLGFLEKALLGNAGNGAQLTRLLIVHVGQVEVEALDHNSGSPLATGGPGERFNGAFVLALLSEMLFLGLGFSRAQNVKVLLGRPELVSFDLIPSA